MTWDLSCRDWEARLCEGRSLVPDLPHLDREAGARAVAILDKLRLSDVPGMPTFAEAGGDWFRDIVRAMFGAWDRAAGVREIVELFLLVPKKNSKTTNGALLMLVALLLNLRPRAPFALMAPVQDTADEAFSAVEGAIALDPVLEKKFHVRGHLKTIVHRETKADLQIMTFDPDVLTGKKFSGVMLDELHVIAKSAKAQKAIRQIRGGMVPYPEAFLAMTTTMPDGAPVGEMAAELSKARDIRDGKRQGKTLAILYEFPQDMQADKSAPWKDPANWAMVNPNVGRSVSIEKLRELYELEEAKGEAAVRGWASQHLNLEIGVALTVGTWAGSMLWGDRKAAHPVTLDEVIARSEVVDVGIDGGGLDDLLGLSVVGRERGTGRWLCWVRAWGHRGILERHKQHAAQLLGFAKDGDLVLVDSVDVSAPDDGEEDADPVIGDDVREAAAIVKRFEEAGNLDKVGVDPFGLGGILDALKAEEIPDEKVVGISQGWKLGAAIQTAERKLAEAVLWHGGQPIMAWCVANARVEPKGNAILITKAASGGKIDPLMATFNAVSLMALCPDAPESSFWETPSPPAA